MNGTGAMGLLAVKPSKWTFDVAAALVQSTVQVRNLDAFKRDGAFQGGGVVFVVPRYTRLDVLFVVHAFRRHVGEAFGVLASEELFRGRIGAFLRANAIVPMIEPDSDKAFLRSLLAGDHAWVVFPEGGMIKHGHGASGRTPHAGAPPLSRAIGLAMRAEFERVKLAMAKHSGSEDDLAALLQQIHVESVEGAIERHTMIAPVVVTHFPHRRYGSLFARRGIVKDTSKRAIESLAVDGTMLSKGVDVTLTIGSPVDARLYLDVPGQGDSPGRSITSYSVAEFEVAQKTPGSAVQAAEQSLAQALAKEAPQLTAVDPDHVLAGLMRYQWTRSFTDRALRHRAFLCAHEITRAYRGEIHAALPAFRQEILLEEAPARLTEFVDQCSRAGLLEIRHGRYHRLQSRSAASTGVVNPAGRLLSATADEIEPLDAVTGLVKRFAWLPAFVNAYLVRSILIDEELRAFDADYGAHYEAGASKPPDVGRPLLLRPFFPPKGGVVLIHGYMAAPLEVRNMAEYLRRRGYAVYAVRLKGHGTSPADLGARAWEEWYGSITRACAILRTYTDNLIVGGFSMGAGLALLTAARRRSEVRACFAIDAPLNLLSAAARFAPSIVRVNALLKRLHWGRSRWEYVENDPENKHINYLSNPVSGVAELTKAMDAMVELLKDVAAPTLVIQGSRDPIVRADSGQDIFDKLGTPYKELIVLERDRHGIINGEGAEDVFERVASFLAWARKKNGGVGRAGGG